jgi:hypothetical protein
MHNKKVVYLLTVAQANRIASQHENNPDWEIWNDDEAILIGNIKESELEVSDVFASEDIF